MTLSRLDWAGRATAQLTADRAGRSPAARGGNQSRASSRVIPFTHLKGTVMSLRWRRHLTGIVAGTIVALAAGPLAGAGAGVAMAGPICPNGTHWDNITFICH